MRAVGVVMSPEGAPFGLNFSLNGPSCAPNALGTNSVASLRLINLDATSSKSTLPSTVAGVAAASAFAQRDLTGPGEPAAFSNRRFIRLIHHYWSEPRSFEMRQSRGSSSNFLNAAQRKIG